MTATQLESASAQSKHKATLPELGLVCITVSKEVRFRTITRTRYLQFGEKERKIALQSIYTDNLQRLNSALTFCHKHSIKLYRMTSNLFPLCDIEDGIGENLLESMSADLAKIGEIAAKLGIRMVLHPDQFVVLSSEKPQVVENSINILQTHARIMDMLGLPRSTWALMNIHGGKSGRGKELVEVISLLPENIKSRLTLENDENAYSSSELLEVCQSAGIPLVFDAHHHICHEKLDSYDDESVAEMFYAVRETWDNADWQLVHISNGKDAFNDRKHSDLITDMPEVYRQAPWIEVEAKSKEEAIAHLRGWWEGET